MGIFTYLDNLQIDKLINLNGELAYLLKLDEYDIRDSNLRYVEHQNPTYPKLIDNVEDISAIINQLKLSVCVNNTMAALFQLVKILYSPRLSEISHLKSASFYEEWYKKGYIEEIYNYIKQSY